MLDSVKRFLIGRPLKNEALNEEKYGILWGLPILASDALSSVAYASEEILLVLVPAIGVLAYSNLLYISAAIIALVVILAFSYRQTIQNYPNGGGAYIVAKENIGVVAGVTAGAALSVDYVLTVAVSISSGVAQVTSAFPVLIPYTVPICIAVVLLLMMGNLRGIRESSKMFSIPAYAFIFAILSMLVVGFIKIKSGYVPPEPSLKTAVEPVSLALLLTAFSNGCAAVTGIEAVSNAVPNFKAPSTKHAKTVMLLLAGLVIILFGGTSLLANTFHVVHSEEKTVLIQIAEEIFGNGFMFYYIMASTFIILAMAANTAFSGFPLLVSVMAKEGFAPRQLSMRGDRLSFSNGIIALSVIAILLIVVFNANVSSLIGLYAIGVFISFTLSQSGMFLHWCRTREKGWVHKAFINGLGALVTGIVVVIIAATKFHEGAWIVVVVVPILILMMLKIKKHYTAVSKQLRISAEELSAVEIQHDAYRNRVIVPIESVNRASIRALKYAKTISDNVVAFSVSIDEEQAQKMKDKWGYLNTDIPLIVKYSPFRKVVDPLLKFIESAEYDYKKGDMITVILPQFSVRSWWNKILHNQTTRYIERQLLKHKHIVVSVMPLQLKEDDFVLKSKNYS
ncbi:MAG: APC family permease [Clostridiales bacterium]|jgi:amino acid transporter|nr:APC family permease [Eubacteriales bacterium]MDH7566177.1 APC family permease [Clostridiales bacterium]